MVENVYEKQINKTEIIIANWFSYWWWPVGYKLRACRLAQCLRGPGGNGFFLCSVKSWRGFLSRLSSPSLVCKQIIKREILLVAELLLNTFIHFNLNMSYAYNEARSIAWKIKRWNAETIHTSSFISIVVISLMRIDESTFHLKGDSMAFDIGWIWGNNMSKNAKDFTWKHVRAK